MRTSRREDDLTILEPFYFGFKSTLEEEMIDMGSSLLYFSLIIMGVENIFRIFNFGTRVPQGHYLDGKGFEQVGNFFIFFKVE